MSETEEDGALLGRQEELDQVEDAGSQLDELMAGDADTELAAAARRAAQGVIRLESAADAVDEGAQAVRVAAANAVGDELCAPKLTRRVARTDVILRALLGINLALVGAMLAFFGSGSSGAAGVPTPLDSPVESAKPDPLSPPPRKIGHLPTHVLWEEATRAAGAGDYARAVTLLERYLQVSDDLAPLERQIVYTQVAYYLVKDGRIEESRGYSLRSQQLMTRSYLPAELSRSAELAEQRGAVTGVRKDYARFLLQLRQASPTLRNRQAEAFLKLGDGYRIEANGEARPRATGPGAVEADPELGGRPGHESTEGSKASHGNKGRVHD